MNSPATAGSAPGRDFDLLLAGGTVVGLGDGPLLARVSAGPSPAAEAAFEALIQRHGPMVARVCGAILGDHHTAEDAVQAVFLVLARRARSIRDPDRLAPWLHGVALRTAREARRRHPALPTLAETTTMIDTGSDPTQSLIRREQAELLHRAIARLPGRYLAPVVLCDLEGLTHAEAASQLNCPVSTVSIRLVRARAQLRTRLARHRLDFESILPPIAVGSIPRALAATATAHVLASRVLWTTTATQWKAVLVAALVAGVVAVGAPGNPPEPLPPQPAPLAAIPDPTRPQDPPKPVATPAPVTAPEVPVGLPTVRDVVDYVDYIGHIVAIRTATVLASAQGIISSANATEGDLVRAEQPLFFLKRTFEDPRRQGVEAAIQGKRQKLDQLKTSAAASSGPAEATLLTELGSLQNELGEIDAKNLVLAPFDGQIAARAVDVGDEVSQGQVLARLIVVDPVRVDFDMDEQTFLKIRRWLQTRPGPPTHLPVRVGLADEQDFPHPGRILFRATQFDPGKGTCTLHAELPNADRALIPGLSAGIRLEYGSPRRAILVPEAATQAGEDPSIRTVWVVTDAGIAEQRQVKVGSLFDGFLEIKSGIDPTTRLVLDRSQSFREGQPIAPARTVPPQ